MFDYENLFSELSKVEACKVIGSEEKKKLSYNFSKHGTLWEIETDLTFKAQNLSVKFYIDFPEDFPFIFPKIFINREDYLPHKYIPHINEEMIVCIFDEGMSLIFPKTNVVEFIEFMLSNAKRIIRDSENIHNNIIEFKREFKAYWEEKYSNADIMQPDKVLHSITSQASEIKAVRFTNFLLSGFEYFVYDNDDDLIEITEYAKKLSVGLTEVGILVIQNPFEIPPYELSILESISIIEENPDLYEKFKKLCANHDLSNILIVFKNQANNIDEYYGWSYKETKILPRKLSGVRNSSSRLAYLKNPLINKNKVCRLTFQDISSERLQKRTTGYLENHLSVTVSGLGSVGSNLIFFLRNLPINKFQLIDNQALSIENIERHLLGFRHLNLSKANAILSFLKSLNPLYHVEAKNESIISLIKTEADFINKSDFHIVAIGSTMIEEFILDKLLASTLTKPTIFFWVEPFLASGQMLFIMPGDASKALEIVTNSNYQYSVLANPAAQKDKTYIVEGSCQTGYFPYSSTNMILFLSAIFPFLRNHVLGEDTKSKIYSWIGDKSLLEVKGLHITPFAEEQESFTLVKNDLC